MSERYSKLYSLPENLYAAGSPVLIAAGALLKDNQTGKVIAQLKMRNISQKPIKAAMVSIRPLDTVGNPLGGKTEYQYLDLSVARDEDFGQKVPVALPDAATRAFTASVEEIVFADNSIWTATGEPWEVLDTPGSLRSIGDAELIKQFRMKYGNNCKNLPLIEKDLWYCACGELNRQGEAECHSCQKSFALLKQIDMDELRKESDIRVAAEKEQAEKEAAAAKAHAKKMGRIAAIVVPILVVLIVVAVIISNSVKKSNAYEFALSLVESGQYEDAIEQFAALGDYKDCAEQIQIAEKLLVENTLEVKYSNALALIEEGSYQEAYAELVSLGNYKDTEYLLSKFQMRVVWADYSYGDNNGYSTSYEYDADGKLVKEVVEGNYTIEYLYGNDGRLTQTKCLFYWDLTNGEPSYYLIDYDLNGVPIRIESTVTTGDKGVWAFSYVYAESGSVQSLTCTYAEHDSDPVSATFTFSDKDGKYFVDSIANAGTLYFTKYLTESSYVRYGIFYYLGNIGMYEVGSGELDERGNHEKETERGAIFRHDGGWCNDYLYTNTYDENGNLIESVRVNADSGAKEIYRYSYDYIYFPDAI